MIPGLGSKICTANILIPFLLVRSFPFFTVIWQLPANVHRKGCLNQDLQDYEIYRNFIAMEMAGTLDQQSTVSGELPTAISLLLLSTVNCQLPTGDAPSTTQTLPMKGS
jgi:hypothetical protein